MKHRQSVNRLEKFLAYVLGRRPDEFGLVPDVEGYVKVKNLLKAMGEEAGWRHVRQNHLREIVYSAETPQIELAGNRIRAVDRSHLEPPVIPDRLPKLLYHPIRQRAYPAIHEKGSPPGPSDHRLLMADEPALARRLGRRIDADPVILTVNSAHVLKRGATVWRFGRHLFLADELPPGSFSGPPLPKKLPVPPKKEAADAPNRPKTPGSFLLEMAAVSTHPKDGRKASRSRKRKNEWKRERKRKVRSEGYPATLMSRPWPNGRPRQKPFVEWQGLAASGAFQWCVRRRRPALQKASPPQAIWLIDKKRIDKVRNGCYLVFLFLRRPEGR